MDERPIYCSFCAKAASEVEILIAGPQVFICNECTSLAAAVVCARSHQSSGQFFADFVSHLPGQINNVELAAKRAAEKEPTHDE